MMAPQMVNERLLMPMKLKWTFCIRFFEIPVVKVRSSHLSLLMKCSYTTRVRNTAVKNEQRIPIIKVVAKPRIGPVPKLNRMIPVRIEVALESIMAEKAFE